jgi:polyhydroxyalkanoate synthesis regulator phasin
MLFIACLPGITERVAAGRGALMSELEKKDMSERTALIKKAVLTSVGATSSLDRIKAALDDAMQDIVKVGQDLLDDLEEQGKVKAENAQTFLRGLQDKASEKTGQIEEKVSERVKEKAKVFGFVTREEFEEVLERLNALEGNDAGTASKKSKSKKSKEESEDNN